MLRTVDEMTAYFRNAVREIKQHPREGLIHSLLTAEVEGDHLAEDLDRPAASLHVCHTIFHDHGA